MQMPKEKTREDWTYVTPEKVYVTPEDVYSDPHISSLLDSIPDQGVRDFLVHDFLKKQGGEYDSDKVNHGSLYETKSHVRRGGAISAAVMSNPGTSVVTEILYDQRPETPIDEYFVKSPAGDAVHDRLESIVENTSHLVEGIVNEKGEAYVVNIGSGPGRDTIAIARRLPPEVRKNTKFMEIDKDKNALSEGRERAKHYGLKDNFEFQRADLFKTFDPRKKEYWTNKDKGKYDLGMEIGIICPLNKKASKRAIKGGARLLKNDGILITSAAHKKMIEGDPFTDYLMKRLGAWKMLYKDEDIMRELYEESGLTPYGNFGSGETGFFYDEPRHFHMLAVGKKKPKGPIMNVFSF